MEPSETIVSYNFSSSTGTNGDAGVYIDDRSSRPKGRVTAMELLHLNVPHTWPLAHPSYKNTRLAAVVSNGLGTVISELDLNLDGAFNVYTLAELAARFQTVLRAAFPAVAWVVTTVDDRRLSITTPSPYTFRFRPSIFDDIAPHSTRAFFLLGLYDEVMPLVPGMSLTNTLLTSVVDLQPVKYVFVQWVGAASMAEADGDDTTYGSFVVPVNSNYGEFTTFNSYSQYNNITRMKDRVFDITNIEIRLKGPFGNPIPFNGGASSMLVRLTFNSQKRKRHELYDY